MPETNADQSQRIPINPNTWIILGCIVVLVVVMSTVMFYMIKHVEELRSSPFIYGAKKTSEKYQGADVSCTCKIGVDTTGAFGQTNRDPFFYFNASSIWTEKHERKSIASDFNASIISGLLVNSTP